MLLCLLSLPTSAWSRSPLSCWGIGLAETLVPGAGYAIIQDWDKAAIFGGTRWVASLNAAHYLRSDEYQEDIDDVFEQDEDDDGIVNTQVFLTRETFLAQTHLSIYSNLTYISIYDLYHGKCEETPETYGLLGSAFQFEDFSDKWTFWAPLGGLAGVLTLSPGSNFTYHVEDDLSRQEMQAWSFVQTHLVGIGEEMLFRGVVQRSFYNWLSPRYSERTARWSSILLASVLFGLAHNGQGGTATPGVAFGAGIYLGWIYNPAPGVFDLQQAIALHAWWDTLIAQYLLAKSDFKDLDKEERRLQTRPLINIRYQF